MAYRFCQCVITSYSIHYTKLYDLLFDWFKDIEKQLTKKQLTIAHEILKEIRSRLGFLMDVGLDYLSLNRSAMTLSGGSYNFV